MITELEKERIIDNLIKCDIIKNKSIAFNKFKKGYLSFQVPKTNNLPSDVNDVSVSLYFNFVFGEDKLEKNEIETIAKSCKSSSKNKNYELPSYSDFVFSISFSGKGAKGIEHISGWHLDYEPRTKYSCLENPKVFHPLFHLHYGGSAIREVYRELNTHLDILDERSFTRSLVEDIKGLFEDKDVKSKIDDVFLEHCIKSNDFSQETTLKSNTSFVPLYMVAPRIPFPPVNEYLGLDFVISNFFEKSIYLGFRKNAFFKQKIKESQNQLWKNYYDVINGYWNSKTGILKPNMLISSLI